MPWANDARIDALRRKYNAALTAHRLCSQALATAHAQGATPSPEQVEAELKARLELNDAQANLLAALTKVITGASALEP
jgi:hypothetical protein